MKPKEKLQQIWEIVAWFDGIRWEPREREDTIPGNVFRELPPDKRILTHWLCYITDRMRPFREVWEIGGPIFAEIVHEYSTKASLQVIENFSVAPEKNKKIDRFVSKENSGGRGYAPRYSDDFFAIVRTLYLLEDSNENIVRYLSQHWELCERTLERMNQREEGNVTNIIAFLLYLLSYKDLPKGIYSVRQQREEMDKKLEEYQKHFRNILGNGLKFREEFKNWLKHRRYSGKRLWAALRDYLKVRDEKGRNDLLRALEELGNGELLRRIDNPAVIRDLELPGDVWNIRFFENSLSPLLKELRIHEKNSSKSLRKAFQILGKPDGIYPEQFDISFDFAPRMCDRRLEDFCPFRRGGSAKLCLASTEVEGRYCPIALLCCGYPHLCDPEKCPLKKGLKVDLCSGCQQTR